RAGAVREVDREPGLHALAGREERGPATPRGLARGGRGERARLRADALQQEDLHAAAGLAARAEEARRDHGRVVEDEHRARRKERGELREARVRARAGRAVEHEEAALRAVFER